MPLSWGQLAVGFTAAATVAALWLLSDEDEPGNATGQNGERRGGPATPSDNRGDGGGRGRNNAAKRKAKLSINTIGVLFASVADARKGAWLPGAKEFLVETMRSFEVFLVTPLCEDDESEADIRAVFLRACGTTERAIFCEQDDSVVHIVRYVSPEVHIETASLNSPLKQFIPALITVAPGTSAKKLSAQLAEVESGLES